jgi:putative DNA primase/helicase
MKANCQTAGQDRLPPHDSTAEAAVLGCVLAGAPDDANKFLDQLDSEHFYDHCHRTIHDSLASLQAEQKPLDVPSLYMQLRDAGQLEDAGGLDYIQRLPDATSSPGQFPSWLASVGEYRQRREDLRQAILLRERALSGCVGSGDGAVESDDDIIIRLAALPPLEYERQREVAAEKLGCRTGILDKLVDGKRPKSETADGEMQGRTMNLADAEPWPESVRGADVLNEIAETFTRFVALSDGAANALALWTAHTHTFKSFICSPRLNVSSPEKGCGKTTLRDVLAVLVPRPLLAENLSVAVLFRVIEAHRPTVLADECDSWLRDNDELRGMLNSGHRRGGQALRCEGESNEVRAFAVFAPAVLCGIGSLPGTLHDRSIVIRLERAKPGELRERFDSRHVDRERELCRKLARFCADNAAGLEACDPALPSGAFNRLADNWRPLFAIAEIAGGDWPQQAAAAFAKLTAKEDTDAQGIGTMLLADVWQAFQEARAVRMFSKSLVESLLAMSDHPWPEAHKGRPITETWLARRLRSFSVQPHTLRIADERAKGYEIADFADALDRYVLVEGFSKRDIVTNQAGVHEIDFSNRDNLAACHASTTHETPVNIGLSRCHGSNPPAEARELVEADLL